MLNPHFTSHQCFLVIFWSFCKWSFQTVPLVRSRILIFTRNSDRRVQTFPSTNPTHLFGRGSHSDDRKSTTRESFTDVKYPINTVVHYCHLVGGQCSYSADSFTHRTADVEQNVWSVFSVTEGRWSQSRHIYALLILHIYIFRRLPRIQRHPVESERQLLKPHSHLASVLAHDLLQRLRL